MVMDRLRLCKPRAGGKSPRFGGGPRARTGARRFARRRASVYNCLRSTGQERPARLTLASLSRCLFQREALDRGVSTMTFRSIGDRASRLLVIAFVILLVNSSYLAAYASPTLFDFGNIALHILFGGALGIVFAGFAIKRFKTFSWLLRAATLLLFAGAAFGAYVTWYGATRPYRWALYTHIALSAVGSGLMPGVLPGRLSRQMAARRPAIYQVSVSAAG